MFRLSHYMSEVLDPKPLGPPRKPPGPVVIWNLLRRCNLACKHCYAVSSNQDFSGELTTPEIFAVLDDLHAFGVRSLILSGGEPLMHPDIFEISRRAREMGFYVALSTNGTLIDEGNIGQIEAAGYGYVGISLDGIGPTHDAFRRMDGAFDKSMAAVRLCRDRGLKVGLRFTLTRDNARELPLLLELAEAEDIHRFYLSHLNYAGRGNRNRGEDAFLEMTRAAMELLFDTALRHAREGRRSQFVTGNNDADGIFFLHWVNRHFPERAEHIAELLRRWGGNASGLNVANIDNRGEVHPDTMWWTHNLGNVRQRPFSQIWPDTSDPLMAGLKQRPRPVTGRCGQCRFLDICNGNTRVRAWQLTGSFWAEDPACYLTDEEIGLQGPVGQRLQLSPYGTRHEETGS